MKVKGRLLIYAIIIVVIVISSFFWGSPGQTRNMQQARRETEQLSKLIGTDARFSNIELARSTAYFGKLIAVHGTVADSNSFEYLKKLVQENISSKFKIVYAIEVNEQANNLPIEHNELE